MVTPQLWPILVPLTFFVFANTGSISPWPWSKPRAAPFALHGEPSRLSASAKITQVAGEYRVEVGGVHLRDRERVMANLATLRSNWAILRPNEPFSRSHMVSIAADSETPWPVVRDAMDRLREVGLTDVDFYVLTPISSAVVHEAAPRRASRGGD